MGSRVIKGAAVGAVASTIVMISATAVAGTGVGGVFNLGKTNTVNKQSTLTGTSSSASLRVSNSGTGPALRLEVAVGKPPMTVSSGAGKVANLDADKLDGLDSSNFYKTTDIVANATHAGSADTATNATHAGSADTATSATTASDASNLGGVPASAYQKRCQNGAVWGRAEINGANASTSDWTSAGVNATTQFVCDPTTYGSNVLVKRVSTGRFDVVFGDTVNGNMVGLGTGAGPLAQATSETDGNTVAANGPWQCSFSPPPYVSCWEVYLRDSAGNLTNAGTFTITLS